MWCRARAVPWRAASAVAAGVAAVVAAVPLGMRSDLLDGLDGVGGLDIEGNRLAWSMGQARAEHHVSSQFSSRAAASRCLCACACVVPVRVLTKICIDMATGCVLLGPRDTQTTAAGAAYQGELKVRSLGGRKFGRHWSASDPKTSARFGMLLLLFPSLVRAPSDLLTHGYFRYTRTCKQARMAAGPCAQRVSTVLRCTCLS